MSTQKSVEAQLKEALEASKENLALTEKVTALAKENELLAKKAAEAEVSTETKALVEKLAAEHAAMVAEVKALKELQAQAAKAPKADLNEYQDKMKDSEESTPANKVNDSGKKGKKAEDCEDMEDEQKEKMGKKAKKASIREEDDEDDSDYGDLDDDEIEMIKRLRREAKASKNSKKADSKLDNPTKEDEKDFDKELDQPGLDPKKNKINADPVFKKIAKKAKAETDVEEIIESPDEQKEEGEAGEKHETTLSKPEKGAKKAEELPQPILDYIKELVDKEAKRLIAAQAENNLGGINKTETTRTKKEVEEDGGSFLDKKKDAKAEEAAPAPEAKVEETVAPVAEAVKPEPVASAPEVKKEGADATPAPVALEKADKVVDEALAKFQAAKAQKEAIEAELAALKGMLAAQTAAKTEADTKLASLAQKFDQVLSKVAQIENTDKSLEMKAAKIMNAQGAKPIATGAEGESGAKTDEEILTTFHSIKDAREQNKFFNAHREAIERAANNALRGSKK